MDILYIDLETTINNRGDEAIGKHQASPFYPDNRIVWFGWMWAGYPCQRVKELNLRMTGSLMSRFSVVPDVRKDTLLVAQNISFDLEHLMMADEAWEHWAKKHGKIWCVQLAEYLLTGQQHKWANLDDLSTKYGGTVKDSRMKEYWEQGICTSAIPDDEIEPYLEQDVLNLEIIYKKQLKEAKRLGMLPLIESQMEARLATIIMEFNGMYFDKEQAEIEAASLRAEYEVLEKGCRAAMNVLMPELTEEEINPNSNVHVAAALFGGTVKVDRRITVMDENGDPILYKSGIKKGMMKTKLTKEEHNIEGMYQSDKPPGANGSFPVGNDILSKLNDDTGLVENILKLREYKKQLSTYFEGYSQLVFPDGLIHGSLNHCQTNTGRLSSSAPNLQNISNKGAGNEM